ncbi:hypothetical protein H8356DRAFT_1334971 [Neocallimastix lanati (nom. inval.)]|nr:hypothetical protein H8356DRAFT_1334971 [Neocallimastix sp. JGI-2020a]
MKSCTQIYEDLLKFFCLANFCANNDSIDEVKYRYAIDKLDIESLIYNHTIGFCIGMMIEKIKNGYAYEFLFTKLQCKNVEYLTPKFSENSLEKRKFTEVNHLEEYIIMLRLIGNWFNGISTITFEEL